ncbi:hypothetical protein [Streptomyces cellulosae]|uniref:hypothetical protein n=1 Tax=Streptomyces cellulosae TaxID=1968 RepID=UPI00055CE938|nr:hypothetical protein [Streptomyces cellulosae]
MSEQTPSQAEGERQQNSPDHETDSPEPRDVPRTTPSQAEGDDDDEADESTEGSEEWESGWSGP